MSAALLLDAYDEARYAVRVMCGDPLALYRFAINGGELRRDQIEALAFGGGGEVRPPLTVSMFERRGRFRVRYVLDERIQAAIRARIANSDCPRCRQPWSTCPCE